jgi:hypothetical protein
MNPPSVLNRTSHGQFAQQSSLRWVPLACGLAISCIGRLACLGAAGRCGGSPGLRDGNQQSCIDAGKHLASQSRPCRVSGQ